jgi:hypothetical protein
VKRVVEVAFESETVAVTYDRDLLFRAVAEAAAKALPTKRVSADRMNATVDSWPSLLIRARGAATI